MCRGPFIGRMQTQPIEGKGIGEGKVLIGVRKGKRDIIDPGQIKIEVPG